MIESVLPAAGSVPAATKEFARCLVHLPVRREVASPGGVGFALPVEEFQPGEVALAVGRPVVVVAAAAAVAAAEPGASAASVAAAAAAAEPAIRD